MTIIVLENRFKGLTLKSVTVINHNNDYDYDFLIEVNLYLMAVLNLKFNFNGNDLKPINWP